MIPDIASSGAQALRFAPALALGAAASYAPFAGRRWLGLAVVLAGVVAAPWLDAALPTVSFTLIQIAALRLLAPKLPVRVGTVALAGLAVAGSAYFAAALGLGPYDPYDAGFHPRALLAVVALVGLGASFAGERAALALLAGDLLAYALGLYANLLDAFVDPILILLVLVILAARRWRSKRSDSLFSP